MSKMQVALEGVYPILATPFTESGEVDEQSLRELVRFQLQAKVNGIALFGNASEAYTLLDRERERIAEIVQEEAKEQVPLVFGSGHTGLEGAVQLSKWAQQAGADALMVMPPYMVKPDGKRMLDYFAAIAKAVDIPIMLQDAPVASGVAIPVSAMAKLAEEFDNIRYVKVEAPPTTVKITEVIEQSEGRLTVFGGLNGMYYYEELCRGAVGTMPACEFPDVCVRIYQLWKSGERDSAKALFYQYLPFIRIGTIAGFAMSVHKEVLKAGGVIRSSRVRNPNAPIDDALRREVFETLEGLDPLVLRWKRRDA
ncbi:dihydrodipicolinate synthase family protein [Paenibacillus hemerocallicola]|uniref:Dihydrodipicolinate synthase family protein n=1 Tax=Paenibacillus hemerocallicola TaxID=1172614 RepID=A0A5C4TGE4_9BACL|nr:dihydrodipicolinate synthase family protein [Paenibacillus hemerocallicola]TNJ68015.1 dihydrodipicolinate synthase family protein [Paenibacillus hemerocallicola]